MTDPLDVHGENTNAHFRDLVQSVRILPQKKGEVKFSWFHTFSVKREGKVKRIDYKS